MKKFASWIAFLLPVALLLAAAPKAEKCPISGKPINKEAFLEINGKKVYFCCKGCPKAYKGKQFLNLAAKKSAGNCPLSGNKAKDACNVIKSTAKLLNFCCGNCPKGYAKKNKFALKDDGPKKCPISGGDAKDEAGTSLIFNGRKLYFCCKNCPKAYLKKLGLDANQKPTPCPISGNPGKKDKAFVLIESETVNFCCGNCRKKYVSANFKDGLFAPGKKEEAKKAKKRLKL